MKATAALRGCLWNVLVSRENRQYDTVARSNHEPFSKGSLQRQICPGHLVVAADSRTDGVRILAVDHRAQPHLSRGLGGLRLKFADAPAILQPGHLHRYAARIVSWRQ